MILERLVGGIVGAEALVASIVVVMDGATRPAVALDTEVVVAHAGEVALPSPTFKESLCESDRGGNLPAVHLFDGDILILIDILLIAFVPANLGVRREK